MHTVIFAGSAAIVTSLAGYGTYRLLRRHLAAIIERRELALAHEVVAGMREVALRLAADVSHHTTRVQEINGELIAAKANDMKSVLDTMARLMHVNERLQERLSEAEFRLQEHAETLNNYAAEARTDALTSLPNRHALDAEMSLHFDRFQESGIPLSVIIFDVDNFKEFNDQHGHLCGDGVLRGIAHVLLRTRRTGDTVTRFGGEEFVTVLPATVLEHAVDYADRVRQAIQACPLRYDGREFSATVSAGVAQIQVGQPSAALFHRADEALLAAKRAGRNQTFWHDGDAIRGPRSSVPAAAAATGPATEPQEMKANASSATETAADASWNAEFSGADTGRSPTQVNGAVNVPLFGECDRSRVFSLVRQRIAEWRRSGEGFAIVLLRVHNCDDNETQRLKTVRLLVGANVRDMDVVGRYAPDCFAILLPRTGLAEAEMLAERFRRAAEDCVVPSNAGPRKLVVSLAAVAATAGDDAVGILRRAEMVLVGLGSGASRREPSLSGTC